MQFLVTATTVFLLLICHSNCSCYYKRFLRYNSHYIQYMALLARTFTQLCSTAHSQPLELVSYLRGPAPMLTFCSGFSLLHFLYWCLLCEIGSISQSYVYCYLALKNYIIELQSSQICPNRSVGEFWPFFTFLWVWDHLSTNLSLQAYSHHHQNGIIECMHLHCWSWLN